MIKQAILIMYHDDYYILEKLLKQIDSKYFDIYLHIDKKVKKFDFEKTKNILKYSNIYFVNRSNVKWSTYSQIKCELKLLEAAAKNNYKYYHLISGNDLLIKDNKTIFDYFNKEEYEYIGYTNLYKISEENINRIKYYHLLNGNRRNNNKIIRYISNKIYYNLIKIQKKLNINRIKNNDIEIRKGANWFSITNDLVKYILDNKQTIKKMYKYSNCADEIFIQTLVYNSKFKDKIYHMYDDEHKNIYRYIDWKRGEPYIFKIDDYNNIINSNCFFARKFSSKVDKNIIDKISKTYS